MKKYKIYLDDVREPLDHSWLCVDSYDAFVRIINFIGLENIEAISLDHDLGPSAIDEFYNNVSKNFQLNYDNIYEKTGLDCAKWLVSKAIDSNIDLPQVYVHSANPIGSSNMMGYINSYLMSIDKPQTCVRIKIAHTIKKQ